MCLCVCDSTWKTSANPINVSETYGAHTEHFQLNVKGGGENRDLNLEMFPFSLLEGSWRERGNNNNNNKNVMELKNQSVKTIFLGRLTFPPSLQHFVL